MYKKAGLFLSVFLAPWLSRGLAQDCSQLLANGIYDIRSNQSNLETAASFSQWFCDQHFSSQNAAQSFGASIGLPFRDLPIKLGFDSSTEGWSSWYSSYCSRVQSDQRLKNRD
jgi:hypothetical protein